MKNVLFWFGTIWNVLIYAHLVWKKYKIFLKVWKSIVSASVGVINSKELLQVFENLNISKGGNADFGVHLVSF